VIQNSPELTKNFVTEVLKGLCSGLDFLHRKYSAVAAKRCEHHRLTEIGIPTDLLGDFKASSITLNSDGMVFSAFQDAEKRKPAPSKVDGDRRIYYSRYLAVPEDFGRPVLMDLQ
jgi:hypothetical protein